MFAQNGIRAWTNVDQVKLDAKLSRVARVVLISTTRTQTLVKLYIFVQILGDTFWGIHGWTKAGRRRIWESSSWAIFLSFNCKKSGLYWLTIYAYIYLLHVLNPDVRIHLVLIFYYFPQKYFNQNDEINMKAFKLIEKMLQYEARSRPTAKQALNDCLFQHSQNNKVT